MPAKKRGPASKTGGVAGRRAPVVEDSQEEEGGEGEAQTEDEKRKVGHSFLAFIHLAGSTLHSLVNLKLKFRLDLRRPIIWHVL